MFHYIIYSGNIKNTGQGGYQNNEMCGELWEGFIFYSVM